MTKAEEDALLEILKDLHSFNKLTDRHIAMFTEIHGIDVVELCKTHGITYNLTDISIDYDDEADIIDELERED